MLEGRDHRNLTVRCVAPECELRTMRVAQFQEVFELTLTLSLTLTLTVIRTRNPLYLTGAVRGSGV